MPDRHRFEKVYGIPPNRPDISKTSLDHEYCVEKVLDSGNRGAKAVGGCNEGVFLVRHLTSGKLRVHKRIPAKSSMSSMLEREVLLLHVMRHQNVVGFVAACITERQMSLYMEYCDMGSVQGLIKRYVHHNTYCLAQPGPQSPPRASIPEAFIWHVLHSLASALQYIHHGVAGNDRREPPKLRDHIDWPQIIHRDIKPDNILLRTAHGTVSAKTSKQPLLYPHSPFDNEDPDGAKGTYPKIVLADFGIATQYHEPDFKNGDFIGTPHFSPPELPKACARGDVWALGASVLSLCRLLPSGPLPAPPVNHPDSSRWFLDPTLRRGVANIGPGSRYSPELKHVLRSSLRFQTEDRVPSWELMRLVRKGEERVFSSKGRGLAVRPLPGWSFIG